MRAVFELAHEYREEREAWRRDAAVVEPERRVIERRRRTITLPTLPVAPSTIYATQRALEYAPTTMSAPAPRAPSQAGKRGPTLSTPARRAILEE